MLTYNSNLSLVAISFATVTFEDLEFYLKYNHNVELLRQEPDDFFSNTTTLNQSQYINLVTQDFDLRKKISKHLDANQCERFTYIHPDASVQGAFVGGGVLIHPGVTLYPRANLRNDIIVHASALIGHNADIGNGTFVGGLTGIGGSTRIGEYCFIGQSANIIAGIEVVDDVIVATGANIRRSITMPGGWATVPV